MKESTESIQEYIEELDAIIEEFNNLNSQEKEDSNDFYQEITTLRKNFESFDNLSEEEQNGLLQSAEALFFSISLFSGMDDEDTEDIDDLSDLDDYDEEDFLHDLENGAFTPELLENISNIIMEQEGDPEALSQMKENFQKLLARADINNTESEDQEEKTIPISEN